jgi:hypothetical protein
MKWVEWASKISSAGVLDIHDQTLMVRRQPKAAQAAEPNGYEREEKGDVVLPTNKTLVTNTHGERFDHHLDHYFLRYHVF